MNITKESWENLELFTPKLSGLRLYIFTASGIFVVSIAIVIQRAVYLSLKSLGSRPINQMIIPSLVSFRIYNCKIEKSFSPSFKVGWWKFRKI